MKNLFLIVVFFLPLISSSQKSFTYSPYFPDNIFYMEGGVAVGKSVKDSSIVLCYFSGRKENAVFFMVNDKHSSNVVFYEDIEINDGKKEIPIYTANEYLMKQEKRFKSRQAWASAAAAINASNIKDKSTTKDNYNVTNGYNTVKITGTSTTRSTNTNASVEAMNMHQENMQEQAHQFSSQLGQVADALLYLPDNSKEIKGDVIINGKLKDRFTATIKIGDDLHEFRFRKTRR